MAGPRVAVLMAVRNGGGHLSEQLATLAAQDHRDWALLVGDDGSTDDSAARISAFAETHHALRIPGPGQGAAANFLHLLTRAPDLLPEHPWVALSDQDDLWHPDRLSRGLQALAALPGDVPALWCARVMVADGGGRPLRLSPPRPRPLSFANALVQNVVPGNTVLLNPAAARLAAQAAPEAGRVGGHDWWLYQIVTGAGGTVLHEDAPALLYRQTGGNQIGANDRPRDKMRRLAGLIGGTAQGWSDTNIAALRASAHRLTPENRRLLEAFAALRAAPLPRRLRALRRIRLYRQGTAARVTLWLAALLGRL